MTIFRLGRFVNLADGLRVIEVKLVPVVIPGRHLIGEYFAWKVAQVEPVRMSDAAVDDFWAYLADRDTFLVQDISERSPTNKNGMVNIMLSAVLDAGAHHAEYDARFCLAVVFFGVDRRLLKLSQYRQPGKFGYELRAIVEMCRFDARMLTDRQLLECIDDQAKGADPLVGFVAPYQEVYGVCVIFVHFQLVLEFLCLLKAFFQAVNLVSQIVVNHFAFFRVRQNNVIAIVSHARSPVIA
jgi:hypothetical protein